MSALVEHLAEQQWRRMTRTTTPYADLNESDRAACRALVAPILTDVLDWMRAGGNLPDGAAS